MKFCAYCGTQIPENAAFCPSCGKKAMQPQQQSNPQPQPVQQQPVQQQVVQNNPQPAPVPAPQEKPVTPEEREAGNKAGIVAFVFAMLSFTMCAAGIFGIVFGGISLGNCKRAVNADKKANITLSKVAKPFAIIGLIFGILATIGWLIYGIIMLVTAIIAAFAEGTSGMYLVLLLLGL